MNADDVIDAVRTVLVRCSGWVFPVQTQWTRPVPPAPRWRGERRGFIPWSPR